MTSEFSSLQRIDLREAWSNEARIFTPWLAENLDLLSDLLGMNLELISTEHAVGSFNLDIFARDQHSDDLVVIENQLERTDHTHLGQVMTYFSALEARKVIWIASEIRDEHRAVISWLNAHTPTEYAFFAIEISAMRIANSPIAPVFTVVEKPNNWVRAVQQQNRTNSQETKERNQCFWDSAIASDSELEGIKTTGYCYSNRWLEIPNTIFILSLALTKNGVGWFIRGQNGRNDEHTKALLGDSFDRIKSHLDCTDNKSYVSKWFHRNWNDPSDRQLMVDWLISEKNNVMSVFQKLAITS